MENENENENVNILQSYQTSPEKLYHDLLQEYSSIPHNRTSTLISKLERNQFFENFLLPQLIEALKTNPSASLPKETLIPPLMFINFKNVSRVNVIEYIKLHFISEFTLFFDKVTDLFHAKINLIEKEIIIQFLILCFYHMDESFISPLILKLCGLFMWVNLSKDTLKDLFYTNEKLIEKWKLLLKLNQKEKGLVMTKPCRFMPDLIEEFLFQLENVESIVNCENYFIKTIEFVIDLLSQLNTRKFMIPLLKEKHFIERCSIVNEIKSKVWEKMLEMCRFYLEYEINEETGEYLQPNATLQAHYHKLNTMQIVAFEKFPEKLSKIYSNNISFIDIRQNLKEMIDYLTEDELFSFLQTLNLLKYKPEFYTNKLQLLQEIFVNFYERKTSIIQKIDQISVYPTEKIIWDREIIPDDFYGAWNYSTTLPIPKLSLRYLTHYDYLLKNFLLFQYESTYEIRKDMEDVVQRMHPEFDRRGNFQGFGGWAKMGMPIKNFRILTVNQPLIGKLYPSEVIAEIEYSVKGVQTEIKHEWDSLKTHDVMFLITLQKAKVDPNEEDDVNFEKNNPVQFIRGCEVLSIYDENNNEFSNYELLQKQKPIGFQRRIHIYLDPVQYHQDLANKDLSYEQLYSSFQLLVRRKPKTNNFRPILETIKDLMSSVNSIPRWLDNVFLGQGDMACASFVKMNDLDLESPAIDLGDTFLNEDHFQETVKLNEYLPEQVRNRARYTEMKVEQNCKRNRIQFTKKQVEAIYSGVHKGLTLIVGPPGTGKTDVAVQIINLLFHNFPEQRNLIVTHSNHSLNDIFEKIINLEIDQRYLLRLGIGGKELTSANDFSKNGRINFLLSRREELLGEVLFMAKSIEVHTFEEYTCESAHNLFIYQIKPLLSALKKMITEVTPESVNQLFLKFPLMQYFQSKSRDLFTSEGNFQEDIDICKSLIGYIESVFFEISELRMFELLRNNTERGNHLISRQAKIIAMTCTHAALKRREFIEVGFEYDNIIMEEASQILEIEAFIPLLLQKPKKGHDKLKRVILIGDSSQLPPIIQNSTFKIYSNMDQSMFSRFLRLKVPCIQLDYQGRSRTRMVDLYRWRYPDLKDLSVVLPSELNLEYYRGNPGFLYEFQFVNVPDFDGRGEICQADFSYQNLAEAEFVISTYMYMCLIGYNPKKISILTTYNGQKELLKDIYSQKCSWNPLFQNINKITTVDKYQGQQNDYILLSLVRTFNVGHIRDRRRLVVALSRARLGLYVFGRWTIFEKCIEMQNATEVLKKYPLELKILLNEIYDEDFKRRTEEIEEKNLALTSAQAITVEDFRHMYRIVQEMIKIKYSNRLFSEHAE